MILDAIPQDDWVSATKISEKIEITPQAVGIIISKSLIPVYVERKEYDKTPGTFIYRRRPVFTEPKKPNELTGETHTRNGDALPRKLARVGERAGSP